MIFFFIIFHLIKTCVAVNTLSSVGLHYVHVKGFLFVLEEFTVPRLYYGTHTTGVYCSIASKLFYFRKNGRFSSSFR